MPRSELEARRGQPRPNASSGRARRGRFQLGCRTPAQTSPAYTRLSTIDTWWLPGGAAPEREGRLPYLPYLSFRLRHIRPQVQDPTVIRSVRAERSGCRSVVALHATVRGLKIGFGCRIRPENWKRRPVVKRIVIVDIVEFIDEDQRLGLFMPWVE